MNMDNVKKAILYRWMYSIFVTKETPKSDFTNKNAVTLLNQAKFNLPYDASVKPFLTAAPPILTRKCVFPVPVPPINVQS